MRKSLLLIILTVVVLACKKDEQLKTEPVNHFNATKNEKPWKTTGGVLLFEENFVISATKVGSALNESVLIEFNRSDISSSGDIPNFNADFHYIVDGNDQIVKNYTTSIADQKNYLKITKIDTLKRTIEGKFSLHFKIEPHYNTTDFEEFVVLENGHFNMPYHKEQ